MNSGFLRLLDPGDVVLADRGFDIGDDIALHGARLEIQAFTRGKKQLSMQEVEYSRRISKVRIHVERVIGLLKNKYTILQGTLPVLLLKHKDDTDEAFIDKLLTVCCTCKSVSQCCSILTMPLYCTGHLVRILYYGLQFIIIKVIYS